MSEEAVALELAFARCLAEVQISDVAEVATGWRAFANFARARVPSRDFEVQEDRLLFGVALTYPPRSDVRALLVGASRQQSPAVAKDSAGTQHVTCSWYFGPQRRSSGRRMSACHQPLGVVAGGSSCLSGSRAIPKFRPGYAFKNSRRAVRTWPQQSDG